MVLRPMLQIIDSFTLIPFMPNYETLVIVHPTRVRF